MAGDGVSAMLVHGAWVDGSSWLGWSRLRTSAPGFCCGAYAEEGAYCVARRRTWLVGDGSERLLRQNVCCIVSPAFEVKRRDRCKEGGIQWHCKGS
jgi:hypothetical protein